MSLLPGGFFLHTYSPPRVSGDEPESEMTTLTYSASAPRKRG